MTIRNVQSGFRCTGIYPFNKEIFNPPVADELSLAERTGINFIPLCSPGGSRKSCLVCRMFFQWMNMRCITRDIRKVTIS